MKRLAYLFILTLVMVGCGSRSGFFSIEGHLLNLNQGEFYVYSIDGASDKIDTIKVDGGRFSFEKQCKEEGTLIIVFPNFSELPIIAEPGKKVSISGDASHLKELEVKGTDENKLLTGFRLQIAKASPPEIKKIAAKFIQDNAETLAAVYVLRKYFVTDTKADIEETTKLINTVSKAQPKNGNVARMIRYAKIAKNGVIGASLPQFTAKDLDGNTVTTADARGKITVVMAWATWSYESRNAVDKVKKLLKDNKNKMTLIAISLDASAKSCQRTLRNDSTATLNICDQMMFDSPLVEKFAFKDVPDNIIYNAQGRIIERSLNMDELETKLKTLLN